MRMYIPTWMDLHQFGPLVSRHFLCSESTAFTSLSTISGAKAGAMKNLIAAGQFYRIVIF